MNEGEFSGGPVQSNPEEQGNFASQEPTTPEQSADAANQVMFSSADAAASQSGKSVFDNSNSFDRPQGAISSDAGDAGGGGDEPDRNFSFGGRSRRGSTGRRNFDAEPQNTFTPNPNAPAFFNDAMASMTPVEQPKSNKKFLKIGIIAAIAILVVGGGILVAVLAGRGSGGGSGDDDKDKRTAAVSELSEILSNGQSSVAYFDDQLKRIVEGDNISGITMIVDGADADTLKENISEDEKAYNELKEFNEKLSAFDKKLTKINDPDGAQEKLTVLKDTLSADMEIFDRIYAINDALYKAYDSNGSTKASEKVSDIISGSASKSFFGEIDNYISQYSGVRAIMEQNNCIQPTSQNAAACKSAIISNDQLHEQISNLSPGDMYADSFKNASTLYKRNISEQISDLLGKVSERSVKNEK